MVNEYASVGGGGPSAGYSGAGGGSPGSSYTSNPTSAADAAAASVTGSYYVAGVPVASYGSPGALAAVQVAQQASEASVAAGGSSQNFSPVGSAQWFAQELALGSQSTAPVGSQSWWDYQTGLREYAAAANTVITPVNPSTPGYYEHYANIAPVGSSQWYQQVAEAKQYNPSSTLAQTAITPQTPGYAENLIRIGINPQTIPAFQQLSIIPSLQNRADYIRATELGDTRTQQLIASGLSPMQALNKQIQDAYQTPGKRDETYYTNELAKATQSLIATSSQYHSAAKDTGIAQAANPYEYTGDLALGLLKGYGEQKTTPVDLSVLGLPGGRGIQEVQWFNAKGGNLQPNWASSIATVDTARLLGTMGPYGNLGSYSSTLGPLSLEQQQAISFVAGKTAGWDVRAQTIAPSDAAILGYGLGQQQTRITSPRVGVAPSSYDIIQKESKVPSFVGLDFGGLVSSFTQNKPLVDLGPFTHEKPIVDTTGFMAWRSDVLKSTGLDTINKYAGVTQIGFIGGSAELSGLQKVIIGGGAIATLGATVSQSSGSTPIVYQSDVASSIQSGLYTIPKIGEPYTSSYSTRLNEDLNRVSAPAAISLQNIFPPEITPKERSIVEMIPGTPPLQELTPKLPSVVEVVPAIFPLSELPAKLPSIIELQVFKPESNQKNQVATPTDYASKLRADYDNQQRQNTRTYDELGRAYPGGTSPANPFGTPIQNPLNVPTQNPLNFPTPLNFPNQFPQNYPYNAPNQFPTNTPTGRGGPQISEIKLNLPTLPFNFGWPGSAGSGGGGRKYRRPFTEVFLFGLDISTRQGMRYGAPRGSMPAIEGLPGVAKNLMRHGRK